MKRPKQPKPTAQQLATERRQEAQLDEEIREQEARAAAIARGRLGSQSLLGGIGGRAAGPKTPSKSGASGAVGNAGGYRGLFGGNIPRNISFGG